jgi:Cu/Zn superoxide dismutase
MKAPLALVLGAALVVLLAHAAFAQGSMGNSMSSSSSVTVTMKAENGSGEDGTATLTQKGDDVMVTIDVKNGTTTPQPAHIHDGTCAKLGGVHYPLTNVVSGKSASTVKNTKLSDLETGAFAINVHKSADDLGTYVSCGDIPKKM